MKIAYIGNNYLSSYRRAECYVKNFPNATHHFYKMREAEDEILDTCYNIPYNVEYFEFDFNTIKNGGYDIVLQMNDKFFHHILQFNNVGHLKNIAKKDQLAESAQALISSKFNNTNIFIPGTDNFKDDDLVFVKPKYSSGSFDLLDIGYREYKFAEVSKLEIDLNDYHVSELINTTHAVIINLVSNGAGEVYCIDAIEQEFIKNASNIPVLVYNELNLIDNVKYDLVKKFSIELIKAAGYEKIKSFFAVQFIIDDDKFYVIDLNTRAGPATVEIELSNVASGKAFNYLEFMMNKLSFEECKNTKVPHDNGVISFAVDRKSNEILTSRFIDTQKTYFSFKDDNKKTGCCNAETRTLAYVK